MGLESGVRCFYAGLDSGVDRCFNIGLGVVREWSWGVDLWFNTGLEWI